MERKSPKDAGARVEKMELLRGVTIVCFAASYAVAFGLELLRGVRRIPLRHVLIIGWTAAGLLAHTLFLYQLAYSESSAATSRYIFSSWYDWSLLAAWGVAAAYLGLLVRRPQNAVGLFLLPLVLALIGAAVFVADRRPFEPVEAARFWRTIHAASLLFGTVSVTLGFAAGLMYLFQSHRLKRKHPFPAWFRLPSLEWLQRFNREALMISTAALAIGLLSGIVLNVRLQSEGVSMVRWTDPAVLSSLVLLSWLVAATIFESCYRPAREGRKVAYLTIASFIFLMLALGFVLVTRHATAPRNQQPGRQEASAP